MVDAQAMQAKTSKHAHLRFGTILSFFAAITFFCCLLGQSIYCYVRPIALFDTMAYVSITDGHGENFFSTAGRGCFAELQGPHSECEATTSSEEFKTVFAYSKTGFATFLRFYEVKPLYTFLVSSHRRSLNLSAYTALRLIFRLLLSPRTRHLALAQGASLYMRCIPGCASHCEQSIRSRAWEAFTPRWPVHLPDASRRVPASLQKNKVAWNRCSNLVTPCTYR